MTDDRTVTQDRTVTEDLAQIERVVEAFFSAFTSGPDSASRWDVLRSLFLPQAVIVSTGGKEPLAMGVEDFVAPRADLLSSGALVDFTEWALPGRTEIFGDVAHWFGAYAKSGVQHGAPFTGRGMKSLQLVRTSRGWRISAAAWDDERDGLTLPPD